MCCSGWGPIVLGQLTWQLGVLRAELQVIPREMLRTFSSLRQLRVNVITAGYSFFFVPEPWNVQQKLPAYHQSEKK